MPNLAGEKFELRLVRASDILLHEEFEDDRSGRLVKRFKVEKVIYNPLILGRHRNRFILLDGANRFEALKRLSCKVVLSQIVSYLDPAVIIRSWHHFVIGMKLSELKKYLKKKKIHFEPAGYDIKPSRINELIVKDKEFESLSLRLSRTARELLKQIKTLSDFYEKKYDYLRVDSDSDVTSLDSISSSDGVLIMYPDFSKENILNISNIHHKLPAGITRHLIPNRVLHIKYPIDKLKSHGGLDKKNSDLLNFVIDKIANKKVRLYKEPILIFDEY